MTARPPSHRAVAGWILRRPDTLTETERLQLKAVRTHCSELDALTGHVRSFATMLTERQGERLPDWLDVVRQDDLPSLHTLAAGIDRDRDRDAVIAGLTLPWSSGVVEGHVIRIKMLKRQMFGRAGFQLLRKRVLLAGCALVPCDRLRATREKSSHGIPHPAVATQAGTHPLRDQPKPLLWGGAARISSRPPPHQTSGRCLSGRA
ncbi:transposase [Streptomyces sp. NBC_00016]